jgi:hypothetical protein
MAKTAADAFCVPDKPNNQNFCFDPAFDLFTVLFPADVSHGDDETDATCKNREKCFSPVFTEGYFVLICKVQNLFYGLFFLQILQT